MKFCYFSLLAFFLASRSCSITQCIPLSFIALLSCIWGDVKRPFRRNITLTHNKATANATMTSVTINNFSMTSRYTNFVYFRRCHMFLKICTPTLHILLIGDERQNKRLIIFVVCAFCIIFATHTQQVS